MKSNLKDQKIINDQKNYETEKKHFSDVQDDKNLKNSNKTSECIITTNIQMQRANRIEKPIKLAESQSRQLIKAQQGGGSYKKWIDQCLERESKTSNEPRRKDFPFNNIELENYSYVSKSNQLNYTNNNKITIDDEENEIEEEIDINNTVPINTNNNQKNSGYAKIHSKKQKSPPSKNIIVELDDSLDACNSIEKTSGKVKINPKIDIKALLIGESP